VRAARRMFDGVDVVLQLGSLDSCRDWGYAPEYTQAMQAMLQQDVPDDFVIATGDTFSVREFCVVAFNCVGLELHFHGNGVDEVGCDQNGITRVVVNPDFFRPNEVHHLSGDSAKARRILGWEPRVRLLELVRRMFRGISFTSC